MITTALTPMWSGARSLINETYKELVIAWSYRANFIIGYLTITGMLVGLLTIFGDGELERIQSRPAIVLGMFITVVASDTLGSVAWRVRMRAQEGTLEQMALGTTSLGWLVLGGILSTLFLAATLTAVCSIPAVLVMGFSVPVPPESLVIVALTVIGITGLSLMMGGATIIFKQTTALVGIANNLLWFTNGTFVGIEHFPDRIEPALKLFPTTWGIDLLRRVSLNNDSLATLWHSGDLPGLALHSLVFFALGLLVFSFCLRVAKRRGSLGQY